MTDMLSRIRNISLLVFRVRGVRIGIDTDQIGGLNDLASVDSKKTKLFRLHELLGLDAGEGGETKVLIAKGGYFSEPSDFAWMRKEMYVGLVVSDPEEIVEIPLNNMRMLPKILHPCTRPHGFWAVALLPDEMILIADIRKMIGSKAGEVMWVK